MSNREKIIKGLKYCTFKNGKECLNCPYWLDNDCMTALSADALSLLKEQEAEIRQLKLALNIASGKGFHYTVSSTNVGDVIIETKAEKPEEGR